MARARMINPNIWDDPSFCELSISARLLYIGMISNADDEGYLRGHVGSIKRLVFGMDDMTTDATQLLINEITTCLHSVHMYTADDGQTYIHLGNWDKYQHQQKDRIVKTLYPVCSKCYACATQTLTKVEEVDKVSRLSSVGGVGDLSATPIAIDYASLRAKARGLAGRPQ